MKDAFLYIPCDEPSMHRQHIGFCHSEDHIKDYYIDANNLYLYMEYDGAWFRRVGDKAYNKWLGTE